jgi:hypothetical protein
MTKTETVKTSQIQVGDIVREHGMRVRIDSIRPYESHSGSGTPGMTAYSCPGTVLNVEEVREAGYVPMGFLQCSIHPGGACWHVQGNDLARWQVEVRPQAPQVGDRAVFQGLSVVVEDIDNSGPFRRCQVRYAATNRTEWIALDSVTAL